MNTEEDPYLIHYYRIGFDGKGLTALTPEEGMHKAWYSEDHRYLVDVYSKVDQAPVAVLRDARDGRVLMPLEKRTFPDCWLTAGKHRRYLRQKGATGKRICGVSFTVRRILIRQRNIRLSNTFIPDRATSMFRRLSLLITGG